MKKQVEAGEELVAAAKIRNKGFKFYMGGIFAAVGGVVGAVFGAGIGAGVGGTAGFAVGTALGKKLEKLANIRLNKIKL
jgi:hypothetical protein